MLYPLVVVLSGPESTRAKAELALEKARLTIIPPTEWPIQRQSYRAEHWPHLTPWPMVRLPEDEEIGPDGKLRQASNRNEYVPAPHVDTSVEHGFVAVLAASEELFHAACTVAAKHNWDLRVHHELPEQPKPDPMGELIATLLGRLDSQEQRIADLSRKLGLPPSIGGAGFETGAGEFMQTGSYSAAQLRRSVFAWAARTGANTPGLISGGLLSATDMQLSNAVSGLVVNTSVGECLIGGSEASNQGGYHGFLSSQNSTTLATANASNPRIDLICATSADSSYTIPSGGTSGFVTIQGVTGTPTAGATLSNLSGAPSLPLSSLLLGYVLVPATATNLTSVDIANKATQVQPQSIVGGNLLAKTIYTVSHTYNIATSAAALDTTNLTVGPFTVPASGAITVRLSAQASSSAGQYQNWLLFQHGTTTQLGNSLFASAAFSQGDTVQGYFCLDFELTGLTPGGSLQLDWAAAGYNNSANNNIITGNSTGGPVGTGMPAVMKVYAA